MAEVITKEFRQELSALCRLGRAPHYATKILAAYDEILKLAYIGDHYFPENTCKYRLEEVVEERNQIRATLQATNAKACEVLRWACELPDQTEIALHSVELLAKESVEARARVDDAYRMGERLRPMIEEFRELTSTDDDHDMYFEAWERMEKAADELAQIATVLLGVKS